MAYARVLTFVAAPAAIAVISFPLLAASNYVIEIGILTCVFLVLSLSLNLVYGFAGLLSFAQLGFWGIGGYTSALLLKNLSMPLPAAVAAAGLLTAGISVMIGWPALRLNRHAFVVVSVAFSVLASLLARDWVELTNGPLGITGLPAPIIAGVSFESPQRFYVLSVFVALLLSCMIYAIGTSRIGRALNAIRLAEPLARSHGIDPLQYRLLAFAIGAGATGVMGGLYVSHLGVVDPVIFDFYYMQAMLIIVIVGGKGSFWGVTFAAIVMTTVPELLRVSVELRMVLYGALLVLAMQVMPYGLSGWFNARRLKRMRQQVA